VIRRTIWARAGCEGEAVDSLISVSWLTRVQGLLLQSSPLHRQVKPAMWNERQWRERRIGLPEIAWSWVIVALIIVSLAAWAGVETFMADSAAPVSEGTR
jgi:hypothetical protein